jgi:hypothetical protein
MPGMPSARIWLCCFGVSWRRSQAKCEVRFDSFF